MEVIQPDAHIPKPIHVGCDQVRVTMRGYIAISLVIGHDKDDIGPFRFFRLR
jgi:hypothetical protein